MTGLGVNPESCFFCIRRIKKHPRLLDLGHFYNERRYNKQFWWPISGTKLVVIGNLESFFEIRYRDGTVEVISLDKVAGKVL